MKGRISIKDLKHRAGRYSGGSNSDGLFGEELINKLLDTAGPLGAWNVGSQCMGETIPKAINYLNLNVDKKDEWGMPLINFNVAYDDNDEKIIKDFIE